MLRRTIRAVVPAPLRALRWRLPWLRGTERWAMAPGAALLDVAAFTLREMRGRPFEFRTPDGLRLATMPNNFSSFAMCLAGARDPELWRFVERRLRPGAVAVDAGANIGAYAVPLARLVGPAGRVIAFEAHPWTFDFLRRNLERSGAEWATAVNEALGEAPGELSLAFNPANPGETYVGGDGARVPVTTLDDALVRLGVGAVDYLKVDVEGFELPMLQGAAGTIAASPDIVVQTELLDRHAARYGHSVEAVGALLRGLGLRPHLVTPEGEALPAEGTPRGDVVWMR